MSEVRLAAAVAAGSACGAVARYGLSLWFLAIWGPGFPWGTFVANGAGSFLIGLYAALSGPGGPYPAGPALQAFVVAGFCGGFTTFSVFSLEALMLAERGLWGMAGAFVGGSAVVWAAAILAGDALGRRLAGKG